MTPPPKVSLVVLNHDAVKKLGPEAAVYLKSIASTRYPNLEIIIVDNASTDESVKMVQNLFRDDPRVRLVKLRENHGYAGGNNAGFKRCSGDVKYVAFLNNDLTVEEEWLEKIVVVMESDEDIAASQPKIMQMNNKHLIDSLGGFIDTIGRAYDLGHGLPHRIKVEKPYRIFYARGAALVVRKKVFEELSGFDEDYFIYYEETDLCWRMRLMGYDVVAVPTSVVYHLGGGTVGRPNPRNIYLYRKKPAKHVAEKLFSDKSHHKYIRANTPLHSLLSSNNSSNQRLENSSGINRSNCLEPQKPTENTAEKKTYPSKKKNKGPRNW